MSNENVVRVPDSKAPYNGLRHDKKGLHFRTYTVAASIYCGLLLWDRKEGKPMGFAKGNPELFAKIIGQSAGNYWKGAGRFSPDKGFTLDGQKVIEKSLKGEAAGGYNAEIPGLIGAYLDAFNTGILRAPATTEVLERWNASHDLPAATKAPEKAPAATKAPAARVSKGKPRKAPSKPQKAPAASKALDLTPKAKV